jgi:hypothetical protein
LQRFYKFLNSAINFERFLWEVSKKAQHTPNKHGARPPLSGICFEQRMVFLPLFHALFFYLCITWKETVCSEKNEYCKRDFQSPAPY